MTVELINDGVHLHDAVAALAFRIAGPARTALITDAMAAAGMHDGAYDLGSMKVRVEDGTARLVDGGSIAGSTLTMDVALRRAVHVLGVPMVDAARAAATTPAGVLGLRNSRCVRVCDEIEGAHVWDISARGIDSMLVAELNRPWGESQSCTNCGKCVQVCPTGALVEKGQAVEEMTKRSRFVMELAAKREANT